MCSHRLVDETASIDQRLHCSPYTFPNLDEKIHSTIYSIPLFRVWLTFWKGQSNFGRMLPIKSLHNTFFSRKREQISGSIEVPKSSQCVISSAQRWVRKCNWANNWNKWNKLELKNWKNWNRNPSSLTSIGPLICSNTRIVPFRENLLRCGNAFSVILNCMSNSFCSGHGPNPLTSKIFGELLNPLALMMPNKAQHKMGKIVAKLCISAKWDSRNTVTL